MGPWGPLDSRRHIRRSSPWLDSAPSTANATRSRSAAEAGAKRPASATYEEAPLKIVTDRFPEFAKLTTCIFMTLAGRTCPGVTTESPRMTLTGFAAGSAKAMISAASAFSALGVGLLWFFVDEPPRTTFTAPPGRYQES